MTEIEKLKTEVNEHRVALGNLLAAPAHSPACSQLKFYRSCKYLPSNHPAWRQKPECDCPVSVAVKLLTSRSHYIL